MSKISEKVKGNPAEEFTITLNREKDDYFIMFNDYDLNTYNYYMSKNPDKIVNQLLGLYFDGNSAVKQILGNFVANVVIAETKKNTQLQEVDELEKDIISNNIKIN